MKTSDAIRSDTTRSEVLTATEEQKIRQQLISTLTDYPGVNASMLASHIRPYKSQWRDVLEALVEESKVRRESSQSIESGRWIFRYYLVTEAGQ